MADTSTLGSLTRTFEQERQEKYRAGLSNLQDIVKLFGSGYGKGVERTALAGVNEDLISRGLGGTTRPVAMSVGMKANLEDQRRSKLAEVMAMMSQYTQQSAPSAPLVSSTAQTSNLALRQPGALASSARSPINPTFSIAQWNNLFPRQRHYSTPGQLGAYTGL